MSGFEARGKWDAWEAKKGMSQEDAAKEYVTLVKGILGDDHLKALNIRPNNLNILKISYLYS